ncbi:4458_t:CDS:2, partial [Cetraspora pellucida]
PRDESGKLVKEFSDLIKTWETPPSQNHQEYQSRSLRLDGYFQLKLASSDLSQFKLPVSKTVQKNQEHLYDVKQNFGLPGHNHLVKELIQNVGENQLVELSTLIWLAQMANPIDKIAFCAPYDLNCFLAVFAWYIESGVLREWLRYIFPRLQDCPKFPEPGKHHDIPLSIQILSSLFQNMSIRGQMGTGLLACCQKKEIQTKRNLIIETSTLIDFENFLIILLVQRQIQHLNVISNMLKVLNSPKPSSIYKAVQRFEIAKITLKYAVKNNSLLKCSNCKTILNAYKKEQL